MTDMRSMFSFNQLHMSTSTYLKYVIDKMVYFSMLLNKKCQTKRYATHSFFAWSNALRIYMLIPGTDNLIPSALLGLLHIFQGLRGLNFPMVFVRIMEKTLCFNPEQSGGSGGEQT